MKIAKIVPFLLLSNCLFSQQFSLNATLANVKTEGLHTILLNPEIRSFSAADLRDLRLYSADNKEVPYFISKESRSVSSINFEEMPILKREIIPNNFTQIIVENSGKKPIDELDLNVANSNLVKTLNISGSNDQNQWFGVLDKYVFDGLEGNGNSNVYKKIKLPTTVYQFLKIEINDKKTAPINVFKIGNFVQSISNSKLILIKPNKFLIKSIDKKTEIVIIFNQSQIIENIAFELDKPNFYRRNARVLVNRKVEKAGNKIENYKQVIAEFELNSTKTNTFDLPIIFEKELIIEIENEDNPPLELKDFKLGQIKTLIVADLKPTEKYTLKTGNNLLKAPSYDLSFFKNQILTSLPEATIIDLNVAENKVEIENKNSSFWQKSWFLWLCIGIAGFAIFYFSSGLLKEMK